jgi:hypothetical protein
MQIFKKITAKGLHHRKFASFFRKLTVNISISLCKTKYKVMFFWFSSCLKKRSQVVTGWKWPWIYGIHYQQLQKFYFMLGINFHLNKLNRKIQRNGETTIVLFWKKSFHLNICDRCRERNVGALSNLEANSELNNGDNDFEFFAEAAVKLQAEFAERF